MVLDVRPSVQLGQETYKNGSVINKFVQDTFISYTIIYGSVISFQYQLPQFSVNQGSKQNTEMTLPATSQAGLVPGG